MPQAHDSATVANRLGALALWLSDAVKEATEAATGMAGGMPAALVSLREWAGGMSVDVIADAMGLSHSRAVRVVDRLEQAGLARRGTDPQDGRRVLVRLTPLGDELAERAVEARTRVLLSVIDQLPASRLADLERATAILLGGTTVDLRTARQTCRLCDAHACGYYEGKCPVVYAADRTGATV